MALWSITNPVYWKPDESICNKRNQEDESMNLAECVPVMNPVFTFSNLLLEPHVLATSESERVRSLAYNSNSHVSGA